MVARDTGQHSKSDESILANIGWSTYVDMKEGICVGVDLSKYLSAGYVAQCHCNRLNAVLWVSNQLQMKAQLAADNCTIEVEIAPGLWTESGYYWEESTLFKKVEE